MIHIKRIYETTEPADGYRILVDRLWPRGIKKEEAALDLWLKEIAPSNELRQWYHQHPEQWLEFQKRYAQELTDKKETLSMIKEKGKQGTVTLLFSSKEKLHNNAEALLKIIQKTGSKVH